MRNYTTQLLKDITDKMDLIAGEEEIDYFSYLRGSDITEGMHCGGYKEAIANALSAANAFEHEIRKDAEDAKAKLTAIFLEAERADMQCYMTLREVSETLKDWMLLARKLRLSMTGGGGYGEQLFCENNIKQWTGETAARLEKESYSAEERAEDRNEAFLAGEYTGGMPSDIKELQRLNERDQKAEEKVNEIFEAYGNSISVSEYTLNYQDMLIQLYRDNPMTELQEEIFWEAVSYLGTTYLFNGLCGPGGSGIDCSGLVMNVYNNISEGDVNLPHSANTISQMGIEAEEPLQVGDIVTYDLDPSADKPTIDHCGIFVGYLNGEPMIIDASSGAFGEVCLRNMGLNGTKGDQGLAVPITIRRIYDENGDIAE